MKSPLNVSECMGPTRRGYQKVNLKAAHRAADSLID